VEQPAPDVIGMQGCFTPYYLGNQIIIHSPSYPRRVQIAAEVPKVVSDSFLVCKDLAHRVNNNGLSFCVDIKASPMPGDGHDKS